MSKLDQIESFGAFLDFLSNPKDWEKLVKDVRETAKLEKEMIEKKRKIKDIDKWRAEEGARLAQGQADLDGVASNHAERVKRFNKKVEADAKSLSESNSALIDKSKELDVREAAVSKLETEMSKVKRLKQEYESKVVQLNTERDNLKQKFAEVKAAVGG